MGCHSARDVQTPGRKSPRQSSSCHKGKGWAHPIFNIHDWEVCHRESQITVSSRCPDTFDQIVYVLVFIWHTPHPTVILTNFGSMECNAMQCNVSTVYSSQETLPNFTFWLWWTIKISKKGLVRPDSQNAWLWSWLGCPLSWLLFHGFPYSIQTSAVVVPQLQEEI
jgi:hypothetical protein